MKKTLHILLACVLLFSCVKELELPVQPEYGTEAVKTYTLSVVAGKGERPDTKALGIDTGTGALNATWAVGEEVAVYKADVLLGTLTAQGEGASTTLEGVITGELAVNDELTLKFLSPDYATQDGTLEYIAAHCDYALASVTVQSIEGTTVTTDKAVFENQQAIVKFTLNVSANSLQVVLPDQTIRVQPASAQSELYVAIPALSSQSLSLKALVGDEVYGLDKDGVSLAAGSYYSITATLSKTDIVVVHNDAELRSAITTNGVSILVANDIDLSNSTLSIESGKKVTIDLNGHTLDRKLTQRGEGGGQVITVRSGATLNLRDGTLQGGWGGDSGGINNEGGTVNLTNVTITGCTGDDRGGGICNRRDGTLTMTGGGITGNTSNDHTTPEGGGGIFNAEGATMTLANVTITGNEAKVKGGGGICNYGTLTLDGCTITGNTCEKNGGGIYNFSTATLNMKGKMTITDNIGKEGLKHNVFLKENAVITVTGALTDSKIGITLEDETGTFTSGYKDNNSDVDPATIFKADIDGVMDVSLNDAGNEAQLANALPEGDIYYIERSWDDVGKCVKAEIKKLREGDYIVLNGSDDDLIISQGTFVVKGDVSYDHIYTVDGGEHNIILCDGAKLSADFLRVEDDNEVYIYGQANNTGQLVITEEALAHHAGIGSDDSKTVGTIVIHGGDINTKASSSSAGIGGGRYSPGGTVIIYGGKVYAEGNASVTGTSTDSDTAGSGIGGGFAGNGGDLTVYGGNINAEGGSSGAGIGSGRRSSVEDKPNVYGGNVTVYGGTVIAHGSVNGGAGIGGGTDGNGATVTIHGGTVKAWGRGNGAGIGTGHNTGYNGVYIDFTGKLTVTGGEVYAYGHDDEVIGGAGIGGGKDANGSEVIITGGYVYAEGGRYSAGIGSGCEALFSGGVQGGSLTVTGGRVEAYGGEDAAGIGGGEDADGGTVTISGGYVYAKGSYGGAGIGGGEGGDGANVSITGGTVHASAGSGDTGNRAIGPGYGSDAYGKLTLGDLLMVWSERMAVTAERVPMCWYRTDVHVEPCTHPGYTAETCPYHKHD